VATISTRLAIDELRSARARRETYVGEWLPEPLPTGSREPRPAGAEGFPDPADHAELADSLSLAFLLLLERLTPEQRAALLLHDVFDYSHEEVAAVIGKSADSSRQLASRARRQVEQERPRFQSSDERSRELAGRFFDAVEKGDLSGLESLLADDVVLRGDGGGKVPALARPLVGRTRTAKALRNWGRAASRACASSRPSSTAGPARSCGSRTAGCSARWSSRAMASGSRESTRSSTRTSSATSARSPTSRCC
jgi:hypothetical protein